MRERVRLAEKICLLGSSRVQSPEEGVSLCLPSGAAAEAPLRSRTRISSVRRRAPHHTGISLDSLTVHDLLLGGEAAASAALQDSELYVQQSE